MSQGRLDEHAVLPRWMSGAFFENRLFVLTTLAKKQRKEGFFFKNNTVFDRFIGRRLFHEAMT
jgi:hypothetical protein